MSARDRFREAEKQSMEAYNRRPAVTPLTDIDRNVQFDRYSQPVPVPAIRYTPTQFADRNSGSPSAFTVLENEADPLSTDVRTSGRFKGRAKGMAEPFLEGGSPYPISRTSAALRNDEISRAANYATIATMEDERRRLRVFNEKRDRLAALNRRASSQVSSLLPTDKRGISELFGDTEMGFDFLRRSNFGDKMQAGLRDTRPMSEYISYESPRPGAVGDYTNDPNNLALNASEALSMQTPETFGNSGNIRIDPSRSVKDQEETLFHELLHKGDLSIRDKVEGLIPGARFNYGALGEADHKAIAAETNRAFGDYYDSDDMRREMGHNFSAGYIDRSERDQIAQNAVDAIAAERGLGDNLFKSDLQNKKEMDDLVLTVHDAMGSEMSGSAFVKLADIEGLSDAEVRTVFNQFNDFMADSVSEREAGKDRNADVLKAAENFSARFAKGGIISALMEGK